MAGRAALLATPTPRNTFRGCLESHQVLMRLTIIGLSEWGAVVSAVGLNTVNDKFPMPEWSSPHTGWGPVVLSSIYF